MIIDLHIIKLTKIIIHLAAEINIDCAVCNVTTSTRCMKYDSFEHLIKKLIKYTFKVNIFQE